MTVHYDHQKAFWEGVKERRAPDHPVVLAFVRPKLDLVLDALPSGDAKPRTMLEVGAGNGFFSHALSRAFELTCLDFSQNMLDRNPLPAERKVRGDAEQLPFDADSFDVVFCGNLLHHLVEPIVAVREMARVARRYVVLIEPNAVNPLMFLFGALKKAERGTLKFTRRYLRNLGMDAGLHSVRMLTQGFVLPNKTPEALLPVLKLVDAAHPMGFYHVGVFAVGSDRAAR
jgi:SAM-dependent methyltransferase